MKNKIKPWLYWTPRILSIVFIIFLALFSLDVITPEASTGDIIIGLLMHNIPVFALIAVLWISWRHEIVGGIAFMLAGLAYIGFVLNAMIKSGFEWYYLAWILQISGIAFLIGILFLMNWYGKKR